MSNRSFRRGLVPFFISTMAAHISAAIVITEIHYHPLDAVVAGITVSGDLCEFIEIKNTGTQAVDLSGYSFSKGLTYTFPGGVTLAPDSFFVLASDQATFQTRYGFKPHGQFTEGNLKNSGEDITLTDASGNKIDNVTYKDVSPWPVEPDGAGNSLVAVNPNRDGDPDLYSTWRASAKIHGSPNANDPAVTSPKILINEVMANSGSGQPDFIELYNPTAAAVNIGGWYLTDNPEKPNKYKIPANTTIAAGGYLHFTEDAFNADSTSESCFGLNAHGEDVFVFEASSEGTLTGYSSGFSFGEVDGGTSFGRHTNSAGETHFVPLATPTPGAQNSAPLQGKIIITEIMYSATDGVEYLELLNVSNDTVLLYDADVPANVWKVGGIGFDFTTPTKVNPGQIILLIDDTVSIDAFKTKYNLVANNNILIFQYPSTLQGNGETVKLEKVRSSYYDKDMVNIIPYTLVDWVSYRKVAPWPVDADSTGKSIHRVKNSSYGNDPANWKSGDPTPGTHVVAIIPGGFKSRSRDIQVGLSSNRANRTYALSIYLPKAEIVTADLFDCSGRLHCRLMQKKLQQGQNVTHFTADQINSSKLLLLRINASGKNLYTRKFLLSE